MRLVYIRVSKGLPTEAAQRAALLAAGLTDDEVANAYLDRTTKGKPAQVERDNIPGAAREGDEVWAARPGVIATTLADAMLFMSRVSATGTVLCIASTGDRYYCPPEAQAHVADGLRLAAAIREDERKFVLDKARAAVRLRPGKAPTPVATLKAAEKLWRDGNLTAAEASARAGMGVRTMYRYFGKKGTTRWGKTK